MPATHGVEVFAGFLVVEQVTAAVVRIGLRGDGAGAVEGELDLIEQASRVVASSSNSLAITLKLIQIEIK